MKRKKNNRVNLLKNILFIFFIIFFINSNTFAQDSDLLDKIIKANEFILKSNLSIYIGLSYYFNYLPKNTNLNTFNIYYKFFFSYQLFNWLDFTTFFNVQERLDDNFIQNPISQANLFFYIYFDFNFNEIFNLLPLQSNLKIGIFDYDLTIFNYFNSEKTYYFGIAPFYINYESGAALLNIKWWLLELKTGILGFSESAAFFKMVFSFYDFAYLAFSSLIPVKITIADMSSSFLIEFGLMAGIFDIILYLLPTSYIDATNETKPAYSIGINLSSYFSISRSHLFKISLFGDYNDQNAINNFKLIDYLNEIYLESNYNYSQKHPTRIGLGIEYTGYLNKNFSLTLDSFIYYNFNLNTVLFNIFAKINLYFFYIKLNYFPNYYPD
ncbi:MAG: hypothetical protein ACK4YF_07480, partial [Exilispira sp.]